jgi:hypothetical protein
MDIQGYTPVKEEHPVRHYADVSSDRDYKSTSSSIPTILPTLVEEEYNNTTGLVTTPSATTVTPVTIKNEASTSTMEDIEEQDQDEEDDTIDKSHLNPALLLNRYDKRKSSPAILGLPFGLNHEAQLSLHLSQQRNSIEAAMLLANFNQLIGIPKANENEHKGKIVVFFFVKKGEK